MLGIKNVNLVMNTTEDNIFVLFRTVRTAKNVTSISLSNFQGH